LDVDDFLTTLPLLLFLAWVVAMSLVRDPYGYGEIGLIPVGWLGLVAVGWLLGVAIVLFVRFARGREKVSL
jgi:hypothetical protein